MTKVAIHTLGCKLNFSESSTIVRQLEEHGFVKADFFDFADMYVINTCSVTENADKKCRAVVRQALKRNPNAFVVIIGCYAQLKPKEISEIPGVDMVLGAKEKFNLVEHLKDLTKTEKAVVLNEKIKETNEFVPAFSFGDRTRSFLKVQDGCDYFCTFCTIPLARGKSRSASVKETIAKAREVAETGVKEVVLTGVNIGDFGVGSDEALIDLIKELDEIEGISRYRISSIEPNLLTDEIIEFVATSKRFVPHFHIPLQSGNDELLKRMRRKYERTLYVDRVEKIKTLMPDACIGVDVIVGFPGETDEQFLDTYHFINGLDVSYLHVFPYSARANTTARKMGDQVPKQVKADRADQLRNLSEKKKRKFYESQLGRELEVLFEGEQQDNGHMQGFSANYVRFERPYDQSLVNTLRVQRFDEITPDGIARELSRNKIEV